MKRLLVFLCSVWCMVSAVWSQGTTGPETEPVPIENVILSTHDTTLFVGDKFWIYFAVLPNEANPSDVIWTSLNTDVATVQSNLVEIVGEGEAKIVVTSDFAPGAYDTCTIHALYRQTGDCGEDDGGNKLWYSIDHFYRLAFWCDAVGQDNVTGGEYRMYDYEADPNKPTRLAPWSNYADQITEIVNLYNMDYIGDYAFNNMTKLRTQYMSEAQLGDSVFLGCSNLAALEFGCITQVPQIKMNSSLVLDAETHREIGIVFVPNPETQESADCDALSLFKGHKYWDRDGRVFMVKNGDWEDTQWEVVPEEGGTVSLSIDYTPVDPDDPEDLLYIDDMDTTSVRPPWHELRDKVEEIQISDRVSYIGKDAFASLTNVQKIVFRQDKHALDSLHKDAFNHDITPWKFSLGDPQDGPILPPKIIGLDEDEDEDLDELMANFLEQTVLYVPDSVFEHMGESVRAIDLYKADPFWSRFNRITDRTVTTEEVTHQSVQLTWLPLENAEGYRLRIQKEGCPLCDTTIVIPALGGKGLIDWDHMEMPIYNAPSRMPKVDDGNGGMIVVIQIKKGSGDAPNEDVEVSASMLDASVTYNITREVLGAGDEVYNSLTKHSEFSTSAVPTYTVTFVDKDDQPLAEQVVEEGKDAVEPAEEDIPEVEGYHFVGWDKEFSNITADLVVKAEYAINTYQVTFVDWDGETVLKDAQTVNWNEGAEAPDDPEREGYTFTGWDKEFSNITADLVVKAEYAINTYQVTFVDWDGETVLKDAQTVNWNEGAEAPDDPEREGYAFTGWDKAFDHVKSDLVVKAEYAINTYQVTFVDWDGETVLKDVQTVNWNVGAEAPDNPEREGYTFTGWDKAFDHVKADLTVKAEYAINTYQVTFVDWDGETVLKDAQTVNWNEGAEAPDDPEREGYTFTGWDKAFDHVKSDLVVKAEYAINTYQVTFVDWDGETVLKDAQTVNWNEGAEAPDDPEREGYTFTGWDKAFDHVKSDLVVKAEYEINLYTVTFIGFAEATIKFQHVTYGGAATAPELPLVYGYHFVAWDVPFDYITSNLVVHAIYELNVYTVTFVDWDGETVLGTDEVEHGSGATSPADPERAGYTFTGWDKAFDEVTSDMTVTAQYEKKDATGVESNQHSVFSIQKVLRDGVIYIMYDGKMYDVQGKIIED